MEGSGPFPNLPNFGITDKISNYAKDAKELVKKNVEKVEKQIQTNKDEKQKKQVQLNNIAKDLKILYDAEVLTNNTAVRSYSD